MVVLFQPLTVTIASAEHEFVVHWPFGDWFRKWQPKHAIRGYEVGTDRFAVSMP